MPRLHKFVTDAEPVEMTSYMDGWKYADLNKYPDRVRIGAGRQYWRSDEDEPNNRESSYHIASAYSWLVGGNTFAQNGSGGGTVNLGSEKLNIAHMVFYQQEAHLATVAHQCLSMMPKSKSG